MERANGEEPKRATRICTKGSMLMIRNEVWANSLGLVGTDIKEGIKMMRGKAMVK